MKAVHRITLAAAICALLLTSCGAPVADTEPVKQTEQTEQVEQIEQVEEALPQSFSLAECGRVTQAKNQGTSGACWAFAVMGAAESSILTQGLADAQTLDLSENHLCYFTYSYEEDKEALGNAEGYYLLDPKGNGFLVYDIGGLIGQSIAMLSDGAGPANETDAPFNVSSMSMMAMDMEKRTADGSVSCSDGDYLLIDASLYTNASQQQVKKALMTNGAMHIGLYDNDKYMHACPDYTSYYEDKATNGEDYADHSVLLVGWDDTFSKDNFGKCKPQTDGAWLIRNSRGTSFGTDGYYWVSYEEPSLFEKCSFVMAPRGDYDIIASYDKTSWHESVRASDEGTTVANVFTADRDCTLKAVGVTTLADAQAVTVGIYVNPTSGAPDSGTLACELEAEPEWQGYHVLKLDEGITLNAGDSYSVVVTYAGGEAPVEGSSYEFYGTEINITSGKGESYLRLGDKGWCDMSEAGTALAAGKGQTLNNACIKALLTDNTK